MNTSIVRPPDTAQTFYRRVGNTNFKVRVLFSESATETMEDKIYGSFVIQGITSGKSMI